MIVFTILKSKNELNQFYLMVNSFLRHNPDMLIYCKTSVDAGPIDGVVYIDRFAIIDDYGNDVLYVSPYIVFFDSISELVKCPNNGVVYFVDGEVDKADMYRTDTHQRDQVDPCVYNGVCLTLPPYQNDSQTIFDFRKQTMGTLSINTRHFTPWIVQRNSYKTLLFPWERYIIEVMHCSNIDDDFKQSIITNCKKHPYMLFYILSGVVH